MLASSVVPRVTCTSAISRQPTFGLSVQPSRFAPHFASPCVRRKPCKPCQGGPGLYGDNPCLRAVELTESEKKEAEDLAAELRYWDKDNDGYLTLNELRSYYAMSLSIPVSWFLPELADADVGYADYNRDGKLRIEEYAVWAVVQEKVKLTAAEQADFERLAAKYKYADDDNNGSLNLTEARKATSDFNFSAGRLREADWNLDGTIGFDELAKYIVLSRRG